MATAVIKTNGSVTHDHHQDEEEEQKACIYATQLMTSSVLPMVLNTVFQLQVFEILENAGPNAQLSASEIVSQMQPAPKNPDAASMLDRMLSLLVGHAVLTCSFTGDDEKLYGLTLVTKYFVRKENGASFGHRMDLLQDQVFFQSWYELKNAVLEGGVPFERVYGTHPYEYTSRDPRFNGVFNKAMTGYTTILMNEIVEHYKGFENLNTLVDVGGSFGVSLRTILSRFPNIKGINFDQPHVIKDAPPIPGLEHVGGDMFESVPDQGDAIFMKYILHDWSDAHCLKVLKNCYKALPKNGKVILVEAVLQDKPEKSASFRSTSQIDVYIMTQTLGGKERTEKEFLSLATRAGFKGMNMCCFVCNNWVFEFYK